MNKKKIIVTIVILAIIAIALYFIFKKPAEVEKTSTIAEPSPIIFPLKKGSTGSGVIAVQKYLNEKYNAGLTPDGSWGPITDAAALTYLKRDNVSANVFQTWGLSKYI